MEHTPQTTIASPPRRGEALSVRRMFTKPGVHPVRRDRVGDPGRADRTWRQGGLRAEGRRVPQELVAELDQHRLPEVLPRADGLPDARALGQADGRPRLRHDRRLGPRARLLRLRRGRRRLRGRADLHPRQPARRLQLAGLVQRRLRGAAAVLRLLHPLRRGRDGVDPGLEHARGAHLPRRLRLGHQPLEDPRFCGAAVQGRHRIRPRLVHARRRRLGGHDQVGRQDPPRGEDGRAGRRPPGHPRLHLVQGQGRGQGGRAARRRVRHVDRRVGLPVDPVPERQQLGPRHRRVHARRRERRPVAAARARRPASRPRRSAPAS